MKVRRYLLPRSIERVLHKIYLFFLKFYDREKPYKILFKPLKGNFIYLKPSYGLRYILGNYEPQLTRFLIKHLKPDSHCIDVGCYIGYTSLLMATHSPKGKIFSIDPLEKNLSFLKKTIEKNAITHIECIQALISHQSNESLTLQVTPWQQAVVQESDTLKPNHIASREESIPSYTLDDLFLRKRSLSKLDMIKIDVEGFEFNVLKGAAQLLHIFKPIVIIESHNLFNTQFCIDFFQKENYTIHYLNEKTANSEVLNKCNDVINIACFPS